MVRASTNPPAEPVECEATDLEAEALFLFTREREDEEADLALRVCDPPGFLVRPGRPLRRFDPLRCSDRFRRLPSLPVFPVLDRRPASAASSGTVDLADLAVLLVLCCSAEDLVRPDRASRAALAARTALVLDEAPLETRRPLPVFTARPVQPACQE